MEKTCHNCKKLNHFASVCKSNGNEQKQTHYMEAEKNTPASEVDDSQLSQGSDYEHLSLFRTAVNKKTTDKSVKPYCCAVTLNTTPTIMEIDTVATVSIISTHQIDLLKENGHQLEMATSLCYANTPAKICNPRAVSTYKLGTTTRHTSYHVWF